MLEIVKELLSMDVEKIINSPCSIDLLKCYSLLYLNGSAPRTCSRSQRGYYMELAQTGIKLATKYDTKMERTNKPNWEGLRFIWGDFYSHETITDEQAINLLNNKGLAVSDFEVLPSGYRVAEPKKDETKAPQNIGEPLKETQHPKQHGTAPKRKRR